MKALRATAALLAGAVLTLTAPAGAQWSAGGGAGPAAAPSSGFAGAAASPMRRRNPPGGDFTDRARRSRNPGEWQQPRRPLRDRETGPYWWGGYGYAAYGWDDGFSADESAVEVIGGRARFEYDRGYPYEHYSTPRTLRPSYRAERGEPSCEVERTRDRRTRGIVEVRVCRN